MPHISVQVEPIAHVGAAACECKKVGIPGQAIFCNSLLKAARQTNSHLTLSSKRAAPGIEPGTSRTRSENHATRPSSHLGLPETNKHLSVIQIQPNVQFTVKSCEFEVRSSATVKSHRGVLAKRTMGIELVVSSTHMLEVFCGALGQMAAARSLLVTSLALRSLTSLQYQRHAWCCRRR